MGEGKPLPYFYMKIAILGKTQTRKDAPFDDPSWEIWGLGTARRDGTISIYPTEDIPIGRWDKWVEVHGVYFHNENSTGADLEHWYWLQEQNKPILTLGDMPAPASVEMPHQEILERFGSFFMRNSVCWAMAYAIHLGADEIGLWGIEQAGAKEYHQERYGVKHFIETARENGIKVTMPDTCALHKEPLHYPQFAMNTGRLSKS